MKNRLENILEKLMLGLFLALGFITPLIFTGSASEAYEFPKMFFVYFVGITLATAFFIYKILFSFKKWSYPGWEVVLYLTAIVVSTVFSSHFYTSLWGYYTRFNGGLISYLVFFTIYIAALNFLDERKKKSVLDIISLSLFPVSLYGISQISNQDRIFSTFGQPNWLAAYIVFVLPLVVGQIFMEERDDLKKYFWVFTVFLAVVNLWFASSLSGVAGLLAVVIYLVLVMGKKLINKWVLAGALLFLIIGALNFNFIWARISDAFVFSTNPQSYQVSDPALIRAGLWQGSLSMITDSPKNFLVGTGPETFPYEFPLHRPDFLNYSSEWDFILNKPHNYYLEIWAESGIIALAAYLVIIIKTVITSIKNRKTASSAGFTQEKFLTAGLVGFFVTNFFGWPTVYTSLLFWLWLAFLRKTPS